MNQNIKFGYYYLDITGRILYESFDDVDWVGPFAYFNRPFVVSWGQVNSLEDYNHLMTKFKELS